MDCEAYKNQAPYPERPTRPQKPYQDDGYQKGIGKANKLDVPALYRKYADDLEAYEKERELFRVKRDEWNRAQAGLDNKFKVDALREVGLLDNPQVDKYWKKCWEKAWEHGHSSGNSEVLFWLKEFAEVVL